MRKTFFEVNNSHFSFDSNVVVVSGFWTCTTSTTCLALTASGGPKVILVFKMKNDQKVKLKIIISSGKKLIDTNNNDFTIFKYKIQRLPIQLTARKYGFHEPRIAIISVL